MTKVKDSEPLRVETHRTREGKEFTIERRARPGRRSQRPRETGEKLSCPFCGSTHPVLCYTMREGEEGERKIRSWECPKAGKMSLNVSSKFQDYIGTILMSRDKGFKEPETGTEGQEKLRNGSGHEEEDYGKLLDLAQELSKDVKMFSEKARESVEIAFSSSKSVGELERKVRTLEDEIASSRAEKEEDKEIFDFVRDQCRRDKERRQKLEARTRVRTDREMDQAACDLLTRMLREVGEEMEDE
jgi:hypothetical protein